MTGDTVRPAGLRREYAADRGLSRADLAPDWHTQFDRWFRDAVDAGLPEPNAMVLSTVGPDGPSSRMVLLKQVDRRGFVFYTNYRSRKAAELDYRPACALLFPWHPLQRQVAKVAAQVGGQASCAGVALIRELREAMVDDVCKPGRDFGVEALEPGRWSCGRQRTVDARAPAIELRKRRGAVPRADREHAERRRTSFSPHNLLLNQRVSRPHGTTSKLAAAVIGVLP